MEILNQARRARTAIRSSVILSTIAARLKSAWPRTVLAVAFISSFIPHPSAFATPQPNVLFIAIDDLRPELGCYGNQHIKTPGLDRFARTAVRFESAHCQFAVCNPSRASLMTGLRPDSVRVWDLRAHFRDLNPEVVTLPQAFRKSDYTAVAYGKIFHNPLPDKESWDEPNHWPRGVSLWSEKARKDLAAHRQEMKKRGAANAKIQRLRAAGVEQRDVEDAETPDGRIALDAITKMRELAEDKKPFFLAVGFIRPHLPFVVPEKYWDLYERDRIPLSENPIMPRNSPGMALNTMYELRDYWDFADTPPPTSGPLTVEQQRVLKHGYYASVSFVDAQVGRVLDELRKLNLAENTIVVVWSDHGWKLGEHGSWGKMTNYEIDTRVPLLIRAPGVSKPGTSSSALVELLDIYPTLCELADVPTPKHTQGKSLKPLLKNPSAPGRGAAFSQYRRVHEGVEFMGYAMRTRRHRLVEWINRRTAETAAVELYDHLSDPFETENVAGRKEHAQLIEELRERQWQTIKKPAPMPKPAGRPRLTIRNRSRQDIKVFWQSPENEQRFSARVEIGKDHSINTAIGHRFLIKGTRTNYRTTIAVKQHQQSFTLRAGSRPSLEPDTTKDRRPNILMMIADDWSWPHASALGDPVVKTPTFDRIAREGVLFSNAFVSAPSCTPSRFAIATGQSHWRLGDGANLWGSLPAKVEAYAELLQAKGYEIGFMAKGGQPSRHDERKRDPFGPRYRSFEQFDKARDKSKPFCFWFGSGDPHRPYDRDVGVKSGIDPAKVRVPACVPDNDVVRRDICDYYWEIQRFDRKAGEIIESLEKTAELDKTLIVMTSDNGMPFPRCKATLYDLGTRVPLAIRFGNQIQTKRAIDDFVTLCDLAPTFLEAAGESTPDAMTGRSLFPALNTGKNDQLNPPRDFVLTGREQHVLLRPMRAIRTKTFLYIRNIDPDAWEPGKGDYDYAIDPSPTKSFMLANRRNKEDRIRFQLAFKNPQKEELYDLRNDPGQLNNVAQSRSYRDDLKRLRNRLETELRATGDPRYTPTTSTPKQ